MLEVGLDAEQFGMDRLLGYLPVFDLPSIRRASTADLVQPFVTTYHQGAFDTTIKEGFGECCSEFAFGNTQDHTPRTSRVEKRSKNVEHGSEGKRFAIRSDEGEGRVVVRC